VQSKIVPPVKIVYIVSKIRNGDDMISQEEYTVIHTLHKKGYSIRKISSIVGLDRRTVSKRLKESSLEAYGLREYLSKLDPYKEYIKKRYEDGLPDIIPSSVILKEIEELGYDGKIRSLQSYMSMLKQDSSSVEEVIRFETKPGYQGQVDWTVIRSGKKAIYGFVMVLGYSRTAFVYFTDNMRQETWQDCHIKAFEYFGGVPQTLLYDNLKSVVIQRDKYGEDKHGFNAEFIDFSKDMFVPKLCKPYRAKTKGKVERFNLYLKNNFYKPLKASLKSSGITIDETLLNNHIFTWLEMANNRIHGTTNKKPNELLKDELPFLGAIYKPIPKQEIEDKEVVSVLSDIPQIDISYHTTISDYESFLGVAHAS
jgi:transposase